MRHSIDNTALNKLRESIDKFKNGGILKGKSGIHIKKSHEGLFSAKAKAAGMGTQEYASHVLANKENHSSATIKQANFARNASKWKH